MALSFPCYFYTHLCNVYRLSCWLQVSVHFQRRLLQSGDWLKDLGWCWCELSPAEQWRSSGGHQRWGGALGNCRVHQIHEQFVSVFSCFVHYAGLATFQYDNFIMKKALRQTLRAGRIVTRSQKFRPAPDPLPGGAGPPKLNQLEMVTTCTYRPSLVKIDARNFELSW